MFITVADKESWLWQEAFVIAEIKACGNPPYDIEAKKVFYKNIVLVTVHINLQKWLFSIHLKI